MTKRISHAPVTARITTRAGRNDDAAEDARLTDLDVGSAEPFCACGRRWSQCDRSRRGCKERHRHA